MVDRSNGPRGNIELVDKVRNGDELAAEALFQRFGPWLQQAIDRKIGGRLRCRVDAEDIMQSAFWSFFRRTAEGQYEYDHSGALCRLLLTIAENKIRKKIDYHTRQRRDVRREAAVSPADLEISDGAWEATAEDLAATIDEVAHIVDQLPARDAEFFRQRYFLGHSAGQIAAETGWSLATVKRVLKRVTSRVREQIDDRALDLPVS